MILGQVARIAKVISTSLTYFLTQVLGHLLGYGLGCQAYLACVALPLGPGSRVNSAELCVVSQEESGPNGSPPPQN
jgi:hypothetical protein